MARWASCCDKMGRHAMRPGHIHMIVSAPGHHAITTHLFAAGSQYLDSDAVFGVKESLVTGFTQHPAGAGTGRHADRCAVLHRQLRLQIAARIAMAGFLSRERIIAGPRFNRWLVPPAALAMHLCIGMAYGFSVFWLPLSKAVGITAAVACPKDMGVLAHAGHHQLRLAGQVARLDVHAVLRGAGPVGSRCGADGWSGPGRARPAWSRRPAGAAGSWSRRSASRRISCG